ncbi:MAG: protein-export chaperone SecB [Lacticaseibacillus paracasei]|jgi:preprotein translocase subunit SecB|uniref:protein-export chaperone SecB n=1 Tax=Lactobacillaceae TaxID=33958 RepID=UPI00205E1E62|nr:MULTISPECIES: protein-export chaperone SecB [Lactobacillaceae]DAL02745.1 MAG TPA: SECB trasnport, translocation, TRANSPORT PROTEIN.5A [Caudoviricetes sp.]MCP9305695.1 protein-export chaperone SecB [Lacticaseibacillus paracasei]MDN5999465.1 protein-export chaperone SecB [Lacticaseibacillus paracasei]MDN6005711.1 protein-export chaperone SecB [Lacticaseibacillus paracasei]MDN6432983.1 protein-export chaperone SecB [Lacticaseibacillus paracasei]
MTKDSKEKSRETVIKLVSYRVKDVSYHRYLSVSDYEKVDEDLKKPTINMQYGISEDAKHGKAEMSAHIVKPDQQQVGDITVVGFFDFRSDVTDFEQKKKLLAINGGAMLYPYLRATVSMVTALDNPDTTVLPTLNFVEQFEELNFKNNDK